MVQLSELLPVGHTVLQLKVDFDLCISSEDKVELIICSCNGLKTKSNTEMNHNSKHLACMILKTSGRRT